MHKSTYRIQMQWKTIAEYFSKKSDFYPFKYGQNIFMTVGDERIRVFSRRDFEKKQQYIFDKYGEEAVPMVDYIINFSMIFDDTEKKVGALLGTTQTKSSSKDYPKLT